MAVVTYKEEVRTLADMLFQHVTAMEERREDLLRSLNASDPATLDDDQQLLLALVASEKQYFELLAEKQEGSDKAASGEETQADHGDGDQTD